MVLATPGVKSCTTVAGFSLLSFSRNTYSASLWIALKDWNERTKKEESYDAIKANLSKKAVADSGRDCVHFSSARDSRRRHSRRFYFRFGGSRRQRHSFPRGQCSKFMEAARKRPEIGSINTTFLPVVPQLYVDVDRDKALKQGVELTEVYKTLQTFMGGYFVDYFNRFGRQWQVYVQAEGDYRTPRREPRFVLRPQPRWRSRADGGPDFDEIHFRTRIHDAIQSLSQRANQWLRCSWL